MPQCVAEKCNACGKRPGFIFGLRGFGLRQWKHEERCRKKLRNSSADVLLGDQHDFLLSVISSSSLNEYNFKQSKSSSDQHEFILSERPFSGISSGSLYEGHSGCINSRSSSSVKDTNSQYEPVASGGSVISVTSTSSLFEDEDGFYNCRSSSSVNGIDQHFNQNRTPSQQPPLLENLADEDDFEESFSNFGVISSSSLNEYNFKESSSDQHEMLRGTPAAETAPKSTDPDASGAKTRIARKKNIYTELRGQALARAEVTAEWTLAAVVLSYLAGLYSSSGHNFLRQVAPVDLDQKVNQLPDWHSFGSEASTAKWISAMPEVPGMAALFVVVMFFWAVWEATTFPRHHSMQTIWDCIRMVIQFLGDLLVVPLFVFLPGELTEVDYRPTPENKRILAACPSIWRFKQAPWFRNGFLSFTALMYYDLVGYDERMVHREKLKTPDGATIALDWWGVKKPGPNNKSKVLFVASTWCGDAMNHFSRQVFKHFTAEGWQCVVMVKRGCGLIMTNTQDAPVKPWCLNGFEDFQLAVDHVASMCPGVPICGLGPSLGATHLRNYINTVGSKSKLKAAVVVDAGEDYNDAFESLDRRLPLISSVLVMTGKKTLEACGLSTSPWAAIEATGMPRALDRLSQLLGSFSVKPGHQEEPEGVAHKWLREWLAPAHGFESSNSGVAQYLRKCQPADPAGCKVPTLEILSFNDLLCEPSVIQIQQKFHLASKHIVTCVTQSGTHVIRWNGLTGNCWISQVSCEFLEAALKEQGSDLGK